MPETTFVGREKYIKQFRQLLAAPAGVPYILNLRGRGGIGKTKILQKFAEICGQEKISHTGIIDFYSPELNSRTSAVEQEIIKKLRGLSDGNPFANYRQLSGEFEEQRTAALEQKLRQSFIDDLAAWTGKIASRGTKAVLIFDTFETVKDNLVGNRLLNEWLPKLKQTVIVLSGRQKKGKLKFPSEIADLIVDMPVDVFTKKEATAYLKEKEVWADIEADKVADKLFELTKRRPLLLALSADWIREHISFGRISPANLIGGASQDDFERKLVENLPQVDLIPYPEREILPYMAHIPRPFDAELVKFLLPDVSITQAEAILKNLTGLSFVKGLQEQGRDYYWFQDELRTLFKRYVFSDIITWGGLRQDLSRKMLEFYDARLEKAKQKGNIRAEQRYIADRLYHEIYLDPEEAFIEFMKMFQKARESYQVEFASILLETIRGLADSFNDEQQFSFRLMEARWLRDIGKAEVSQERSLGLLNEYQADPNKTVFIYNALGGSAVQLGEFEKGLEYHTKSLELSKKLKLDERFALEETNIGRIHQLMGNWETAVDHFKEAYDLACESNDGDRIADNLGHVYGLLGQFEVGLDYCSQAIELWENLKQPKRAARARVLRGAVYRYAGRYEESIQDIEGAIPIFDAQDYLNLAEAKSHLGLTQWVLSDKTHDNSLLNKSIAELEGSINISREHNLKIELYRVLHEISHTYWQLGEETRQIKKEAYNRTIKVPDIRHSIDDIAIKLYDWLQDLG